MSTETIAAAHSSTQARVEVIVAQINYIVRKTTGSTFIGDVLDKGMVRNKWIACVRVQALDEKDRIWAEIEVKVDWDKHKINLRRHGETILIDKNLPEGEQVSWVIEEIVKWFKNYTQKSHLHTTWTIDYVPEIENDATKRDETTKALGLVYGPIRKWADGTQKEEVLFDRPENLDELSITLRAALS